MEANIFAPLAAEGGKAVTAAKLAVLHLCRYGELDPLKCCLLFMIGECDPDDEVAGWVFWGGGVWQGWGMGEGDEGWGERRMGK